MNNVIGQSRSENHSFTLGRSLKEIQRAVELIAGLELEESSKEVWSVFAAFVVFLVHPLFMFTERWRLCYRVLLYLAQRKGGHILKVSIIA